MAFLADMLGGFMCETVETTDADGNAITSYVDPACEASVKKTEKTIFMVLAILVVIVVAIAAMKRA